MLISLLDAMTQHAYIWYMYEINVSNVIIILFFGHILYMFLICLYNLQFK